MEDFAVAFRDGKRVGSHLDRICGQHGTPFMKEQCSIGFEVFVCLRRCTNKIYYTISVATSVRMLYIFGGVASVQKVRRDLLFTNLTLQQNCFRATYRKI